MELQELGLSDIQMRALKKKEGCIRGGATPASTSALL